MAARTFTLRRCAMHQGASENASDENDNGVVIGEGNTFQPASPQYIIVPPRPPLPTKSSKLDGDVDTKPLDVISDASSKDAKDGGTRKVKPMVDSPKIQKNRQRQQRKWQNGESEDGKSWFTRHHWREPFFRLLLNRVGDPFWVFLVHIGLGLMVIPLLLRATSPDVATLWIIGGVLFLLWFVYLLIRTFFVWVKMYRRAKKLKLKEKRDSEKQNREEVPAEKVRPLNPGEATSINILLACFSFLVIVGLPALFFTIWPTWWWLMLVIGVLLMSCAIFREWYRWRDTTILIEITHKGIKITYGQPRKLILGFVGTTVGAVPDLEGSNEIEVYISLADQVIFRRCGDVNIQNKLTGDNSQYLDSIPNVAAVQEFLIRDRESIAA